MPYSVSVIQELHPTACSLVLEVWVIEVSIIKGENEMGDDRDFKRPKNKGFTFQGVLHTLSSRSVATPFKSSSKPGDTTGATGLFSFLTPKDNTFFTDTPRSKNKYRIIFSPVILRWLLN